MTSVMNADASQHPQVIKPSPVPVGTDGGDESVEWATFSQRTARCVPCDQSPTSFKTPSLNPATHRAIMVLTGDNTLAHCTCKGIELNPTCPAYCPGDESLNTWREFGCGCGECSDCPTDDRSYDGPYDYRDCLCDCGIPRDRDYPEGEIPSSLRRPLIETDADGTIVNVIPSKWGTFIEKQLVAKHVPWSTCRRKDCACTASYDGTPGEYCCNTCYEGTPCKENKHMYPPPNKCRHCSAYVWNIKKHLGRCPENKSRGNGGNKARNGKK